MDLGLIIILILSLWVIAEISALLIINWKKVIGKYKKGEKIDPESHVYADRALTLGGLTFAAIALLVGAVDDINSIVETLIVLVFGFCLLLFSFKVEVLTANRRIGFILQEKCFNFGYLSLIFALMVFFYESATYIIFEIIVVFILLIVVLHLKEFYNDCKTYTP